MRPPCGDDEAESITDVAIPVMHTDVSVPLHSSREIFAAAV